MKDYLFGIVACCSGVVCYECFDFSFTLSLLVAACVGGWLAAIDYGIKKFKKT